jgi:DNA repair protein RadA/Sms
VTKDGTLAGPRVLEHMVDAVLYMEGEALSAYRILKGTKNRFGSTNEVGVFQMGSRGLEEVPDPSRALLSQRRTDAVGSAVLPVMEGNRPILIEVQALTSPSYLPAPRRIANGVDFNRLLMLLAVLTQRAGLAPGSQDVIVNVVGGLRIDEPAADLAVALAVASSLRNVPLDPGMVAAGEVGLTGELRSVPQLERRLSEAARLGYSRCLVPSLAGEALSLPGMQVEPAATIAQALRKALPLEGTRAPTQTAT